MFRAEPKGRLGIIIFWCGVVVDIVMWVVENESLNQNLTFDYDLLSLTSTLLDSSEARLMRKTLCIKSYFSISRLKTTEDRRWEERGDEGVIHEAVPRTSVIHEADTFARIEESARSISEVKVIGSDEEPALTIPYSSRAPSAKVLYDYLISSFQDRFA